MVLAEDTSNHQLVAVKKLPRALACDTHTERELLLHSRLKHPHIVKFRSVFLSKQHCNIVMEYVPGEGLQQGVATRQVWSVALFVLLLNTGSCTAAVCVLRQRCGNWYQQQTG